MRRNEILFCRHLSINITLTSTNPYNFFRNHLKTGEMATLNNIAEGAMGLFEEERPVSFLLSYCALIDTFPLCVGSAEKKACDIIYDTGEGSKLQNAGHNLPTVH